MDFEWDLKKELENSRKHGVFFIEAVESFSDSHGIQLKDLKHSYQEDRFYWIGSNVKGRILTTWYVLRRGVIRIIGCAEVTKFRRVYEEVQRTGKF